MGPASANQHSSGPTRGLRPGGNRLQRWLPFVILAAAIAYGLLAAFLAQPPANPADLLALQTNLDTEIEIQDPAGYLIAPMSQALEENLRQSQAWTPISLASSGIGYPGQPATFRLHLHNPAPVAVAAQLVVSAPHIDHLAPVLVAPDGQMQTLPVMGDLYPFEHRYISLPQWVWPVTLEPGTSTLLMEIQNTGPVMLPLSLVSGDEMVRSGSHIMAWKSFVTGLLVFALLLNLSIVVKLRRPGLAWLSVLMVSVIYSQLVMDGLGLWLIWPGLPELNALLSVSLPLCLIALCEFTPHFIAVGKNGARGLRGFSLAAGLHLLAVPFSIRFLGQDTFLVITTAGGLFILGLVLGQIREHVYARYFALSVLAIFAGAVTTALRTIGWLPVTPLTDSAFFLGAAAGSLILTSGVGRLLLEERKRRLSADIRAREEQALRTRIEQDYDRILKTHRVTGKPNRAMLEEALAAIDSRRSPYTLCMVRLTRFNELEQALGYRSAEELLRQYLRQMNRFLKQTLGEQLIPINGYAVATLDTMNHAFALYRNNSEPDAEAHTLGAISDWLSGNFREGRFSFSWEASVGVAHAPEHGTDASSLLSAAGFATLNNDNALTVYDPSIAEWQYRQQILMLDVEDALKSGEMWLEYQPKVNIRDGRISSVEALLRWEHSEFGRIPPDHWIPLAEEVGIIHLVTEWVLDRACRDASCLREQYGEHIAISVNISAKDLAQPRFHELARSILRHHHILPRCFILEITETAMMTEPALAQSTIQSLSDMGFRIALDDFGSGHSSLGTLALFRLDELKIDRSFLENVLDYPARQKILKAALELGTALDLDVVVEGVEEEAIALWLQQFPGLQGQGYYLSLIHI